jgi:uncharacterized damage-inducible protein DinB
MKISDLLLGEIQQEAVTTRRLLERVPQASFSWQPHEKSMTLGRLATHLATIPARWLGLVFTQDELDLAAPFTPPNLDDVNGILELFDTNLARALELVKAQSDEQMLAPWRLRMGAKVVAEMPRYAFVRGLGLNHIVHHRGQLAVYLRLLNVPLPSIYGPTADEAPTFEMI